MRSNPLDPLFPGLTRRPAPFALRREKAPDDDHGDDGTDEDLTVPPREDRRPTDGNRGYRNGTGRGRKGRRSTFVPHYTSRGKLI